MTNPRTIMIAELATTENFLVIKELVELWPEILVEHHKKLFEDAFTLEGIWEGYKISGMPSNHRLEVVIPSKVNRNLFRFVINIGDDDRNWYFGIKGPWDLATKYPEIETLKDACTQYKFKSWQDWMYKYFNYQRSDVYGLLNNQADVKPILVSMVKQFHEECKPLKDQVEGLNDILVTG